MADTVAAIGSWTLRGSEEPLLARASGKPQPALPSHLLSAAPASPGCLREQAGETISLNPSGVRGSGLLMAPAFLFSVLYQQWAAKPYCSLPVLSSAIEARRTPSSV